MEVMHKDVRNVSLIQFYWKHTGTRVSMGNGAGGEARPGGEAERRTQRFHRAKAGLVLWSTLSGYSWGQENKLQHLTLGDRHTSACSGCYEVSSKHQLVKIKKLQGIKEVMYRYKILYPSYPFIIRCSLIFKIYWLIRT